MSTWCPALGQAGLPTMDFQPPLQPAFSLEADSPCPPPDSKPHEALFIGAQGPAGGVHWAVQPYDSFNSPLGGPLPISTPHVLMSHLMSVNSQRSGPKPSAFRDGQRLLSRGPVSTLHRARRAHRSGSLGWAGPRAGPMPTDSIKISWMDRIIVVASCPRDQAPTAATSDYTVMH